MTCSRHQQLQLARYTPRRRVAVILTQFYLVYCAAGSAGGDASFKKPTEKQVRAACPDEVAACQNDGECPALFAKSFHKDAHDPDNPHHISWDVASKNPQMAAVTACFQVFVSAVAEETQLREHCPGQVAACEADMACKDEFRLTLRRKENRDQAPHQLLQAVINCFTEKKVPQGEKMVSLIRTHCPKQLAVLEKDKELMQEALAAFSNPVPPEKGAPEVMALIECMKEVGAGRRGAAAAAAAAAADVTVTAGKKLEL